MGVLRLFALEALWLAVLGTVLGLLVTLVVALLVNHANISYVPPNSSTAVPLLVNLDWSRIGFVSSVVILLSIAASFMPSLKAARRDIVDALAFA